MERPKYIYVDFENVGMDGLQGAFRLSSEDKIFGFDSDKKKFNRVETDAAIECVSCVNGKKNIADFIMKFMKRSIFHNNIDIKILKVCFGIVFYVDVIFYFYFFENIYLL